MTKEELEKLNVSLEEQNEKLKAEVQKLTTEKSYIASAVEQRNKEIVVLKETQKHLEEKSKQELNEMAQKISNVKQSNIEIDQLKKQLELARAGERTRAEQLQELMKITSNILNSLQPQIENAVSLFNLQVDKISNTFKPQRGE